jgi:hypothetical protein
MLIKRQYCPSPKIYLLKILWCRKLSESWKSKVLRMMDASMPVRRLLIHNAQSCSLLDLLSQTTPFDHP